MTLSLNAFILAARNTGVFMDSRSQCIPIRRLSLRMSSRRLFSLEVISQNLSETSSTFKLSMSVCLDPAHDMLELAWYLGHSILIQAEDHLFFIVCDLLAAARSPRVGDEGLGAAPLLQLLPTGKAALFRHGEEALI